MERKMREKWEKRWKEEKEKSSLSRRKKVGRRELRRKMNDLTRGAEVRMREFKPKYKICERKRERDRKKLKIEREREKERN